MKEERLKRMEEFIRQKEMCSLDVLCEIFKISKVTVRRDVEELVRSGIAEKIYGGIRFRSTVPYSQRDIHNVAAKDIIGKLAASLINGGDTVFIDSGTTTPHLIKYVTDKNINVITHSFNAIEQCRDYKNISIIMIGGEFNRLTNSFTGDNTIRSLNLYNISKAFLAATGVSSTCGFTNSSPLETGIKKEAIAKCPEKYIMIDHEKWDRVSLRTFAPIEGITGVITDKKPSDEYMRLFENKCVKVLYGDN